MPPLALPYTFTAPNPVGGVLRGLLLKVCDAPDMLPPTTSGPSTSEVLLKLPNTTAPNPDAIALAESGPAFAAPALASTPAKTNPIVPATRTTHP